MNNDSKDFYVNKPVSEILDGFFEDSLQKGASDIHIVPIDGGVRVRFRIDGLLHDIVLLPISLHHALIARLKVLARLRSDVHSLPHDGRFFYYPRDGLTRIDIRLSIVPTYHGESVVARLLVPHFKPHSLKDLDFSDRDEKKILQAIKRQQGMIVVSGPTGSGKTTTLYTLIRLLDQPDISIITIEDPVEYALSGIAQIHVQSEHGITFASALRAVLRQDPDVIMVGEIRDTDTARIAIQAALTGHLVICTLHATDASSVIPRLFDIGVDPYLVAATLRLVIGQRLVRKVSMSKKSESSRKEEMSKKNEFSGRMGVNEVLCVDAPIRKAIFEKKSSEEIKAIAIDCGMVPMHDDGINKCHQGLTTPEEIARVLSE